MKIKQATWDYVLNVMEIVLDDDRVLLLIFSNTRGVGNKYLNLRHLQNIQICDSFYITQISTRPPVRDLQEFMKKVIFEYDGRMERKVEELFVKEKKTTKD